MRRKSILAIVLGMSLLLSTPVMADVPDINLASMSTEDLVSLRDSINAEIANKGGDNIIGEGVYTVGTDIKAGNFKVTPMKGYDGRTSFYIFKDSSEYDDYKGGNYDAGDCVIDLDSYEENDTDSGNLVLKDGEILYIDRGNAIIEEVNPSWKTE